jgi:hypothetical protein
MFNFNNLIINNFRGLFGPPSYRGRKLSDAELAELKGYIRRFHPAEGGWFVLAGLATLVQLCLVAGLLATLSVQNFDVTVAGDRLWRIAFLSIVFIGMVYRGRWLAEREGYDTGFLYWFLKLLAIVLLARLSPYVVNPAQLSLDLPRWFTSATAIFDPGFMIHLLLTFATFRYGERFGRSLLLLYPRPQEVLAEKGGMATGSVGFREDVDHPFYYKELKRLVLIGGIVQAIAICIIGGGIKNPTEDPGLLLQAQIMFGYIVFSLIFLSLIRLRYLRTNWYLADLREPPGLGNRWVNSFIIFAVVVGLLLFLVPTNLGLPSLNVGLFERAGQNGELNQEQGPPPPPKQPEPPPNPNRFEFPPWILPTLLTVMGILGFIGLVLVLRYMPWLGRNRPKLQALRLNLAKLGEALLATGRGFVNWLLSIFGRRKPDEPYTSGGQGTTRRSFFDRFRREKLPDHPREQVRFYYRQTLRRANKAGYARRADQTPHEFADYLSPKLPQTEAVPQPDAELERLNSAYEEARFSPHPVPPEVADETARRTAQLNAALRQARKKRGNKG